MKNTLKLGFLALTLSLVSNWAVAAPFAASSVSSISPCPSFCGGFGGSSNFDINGAEGDETSFSSLSTSQGDGRAQTIFVGNSLLPQLSADAFSVGGFNSSQVSSSATGMQQYIYSGVATTVTLDAVFDGVISGDAFINGSIVVAHGIPGVDFPFFTDFSTVVSEILDGELGNDFPTLLGSDRSVLNETGENALSISFDVNDSESIFVWSQLMAQGIRGGSADAFNTMTMAFSDPTGLAPQLGTVVVNPVPEPANLALILAGLLGISFARFIERS